MTLYDLIVKTRPNGNKEITVKNDDAIDSLTLMLDQKGKQYNVVGSKTSNVYKFIFPSLDFGLVRLRFVSKMGTIKKASPIFEITIENDVISSPSETPAYISNLEDLDNKYKTITDTNITNITTLTNDFNTFKTDQNTKITSTNTTLNSYIASNDAVVSTLSTNMMSKASNAYVDTSITNALANYYTKLESDGRYIPYTSFTDNYYKITGIDTNKIKTTIVNTQTLDLSTATAADKVILTPLSNNGQFLLPSVESRFGTQNYTTKTQIENRYLIHYNNDKGGVDTNQEAGFYYGFNTVDTPVNNGYQIAGLGLYTYSTTNAGDHGLAFYTYYRQDKTANYSKTKKTIVTSGNSTIDGAIWNLTGSLQFSGTSPIYMTPEADIFIQPLSGKTLTIGSGISINGGILKINPQYGRGLLLPRYDTTDSTLKRNDLNYSFGWSGTTTQYDKFAFFRNSNKQEFMHTIMSMGDNNQYSTSGYNVADNIVGTNAGFTILSNNQEKKVSIGQITRTLDSASIDWIDLLSNNDVRVDENSTPSNGIKYYPNDFIEMWFKLTTDNVSLVWKTEAELAEDAAAIANGTATDYNRQQYKTIPIAIEQNYDRYVMMLEITCPVLINRIYDMSITGKNYYTTIVSPNEDGTLTPDGKLILGYGGGYLPDKPAIGDPNYESLMLNWTNQYNNLFNEKSDLLANKIKILVKKL